MVILNGVDPSYASGEGKGAVDRLSMNTAPVYFEEEGDENNAIDERSGLLDRFTD